MEAPVGAPIKASMEPDIIIRAQASTAEILMQQAEQQVVLPDAIDTEIASRQAFAVKATFLQHPKRRSLLQLDFSSVATSATVVGRSGRAARRPEPHPGSIRPRASSVASSSSDISLSVRGRMRDKSADLGIARI